MKDIDEDVEMRRLLAEERFFLDVTEKICEAIEARGIKRTDLAERLKVSPQEITQRLRGTRNLTIKSVADMMDALGYDVTLDVRDRRENHRGVPLRMSGTSQRWGSGIRYTPTGTVLRSATAGAA